MSRVISVQYTLSTSYDGLLPSWFMHFAYTLQALVGAMASAIFTWYQSTAREEFAKMPSKGEVNTTPAVQVLAFSLRRSWLPVMLASSNVKLKGNGPTMLSGKSAPVCQGDWFT